MGVLFFLWTDGPPIMTHAASHAALAHLRFMTGVREGSMLPLSNFLMFACVLPPFPFAAGPFFSVPNALLSPFCALDGGPPSPPLSFPASVPMIDDPKFHLPPSF